MKILIIGNGFLGSRCAAEWPDAAVCDNHIASVDDVRAILDTYKPDAVLNAAGVVGKPNVDWCETHQLETINGNTILPLQIAQACQERGVYMLHIGTGCVFYGYSQDPNGWTENDIPNPLAVYTKCKYAADLALSTLPNIGIARIRMPLDSMPSRGNLIDKLKSFPKVIDVINSITVVDDMIKVFRQLLEKKAEGIFHVTNPGAIRHKEILGLYEKYVDPKHSNEWIAEGDLLKLGLVNKKRSNTILQSLNLPKFGINMRPVLEAVEEAMKKYGETNP